LRRFSEEEVFCLKEDAISEQDGSDPANPEQALTYIEDDQAFSEDNLNDLHAKLYVADAGSEGRIWTGSANATDAAFSKNVEFLVELRGKKKYCSIDDSVEWRQGNSGRKGSSAL
jgi:HKD family nuclease